MRERAHIYTRTQSVESEGVDLGVVAAVLGNQKGVLDRGKHVNRVEAYFLHQLLGQIVGERNVGTAQEAGILDIAIEHSRRGQRVVHTRIGVRLVLGRPGTQPGLGTQVTARTVGDGLVTQVGVDEVFAIHTVELGR